MTPGDRVRYSCHADLPSEARGLHFGLHLHLYFVYAYSEDSATLHICPGYCPRSRSRVLAHM